MKTVRLFKLGLVIAPRLPLSLGYAICRLAGVLLYLINRMARQAVQQNMRHVLGPAASQRLVNRLARGVFVNNIKNYFDVLRLESLSNAEIAAIVQVSGKQYTDAALAAGRGIILFSAHLGNFNLIIQLPTALGYKLNLFAEPIQPPEMYQFMTELRSSHGTKLIPVDDPGAIMRSIRALRNNEIIGIAADRDVTNGGQMVQFFDAPMRLPVGAVQLAARLGCPLIPVCIYRQSDNHSQVEIMPPLELQKSGDSEADTTANLRKVAATLESFIARYPDQWVVLQPMWKVNSDG